MTTTTTKTRGVKCSWKEMQRLHRDVLPAVESGRGVEYAAVRCVSPQTVTDWRNTSRVMEVIEENREQLGYPDLATDYEGT